MSPEVTVDELAVERRMREAAEQAGCAFWMVGVQSGQLTYASPTLPDVIGVPVDAMRADAMAWVAMLEPEEMPRAVEAIDRVSSGASGSGGWSREVQLLQNRWARLRIFPVHDKLGRVTKVGFVAVNSTVRRESWFKLRDAWKEADLANRAKTQFLANMSHEVRTPMNGILGFTEMLRGTSLDEEQEEMVGVVLQSAEHLLGLLNDLLDISRLELDQVRIEPADCDLAKVAQECVALFGAAARRKGLSLELHVDPGFPSHVRLDKMRLRQVLINLLDNAVKFTDEGGISLGLASTTKGEEVDLSISVTDTGLGVSPDEVAQIFGTFSQVDGSVTRVHGGLGLGLSICRRLVELMGGKLEVQHPAEGGTCFLLSMRAELAAPPAVVDVVASLPAGRGPRRVLVAEDDPVAQSLMTRLLESLGCEVIVVNNGKLAVERVAEGGVDLVFLDLQMPVMDGYAALEEIRALDGGADLRIVALTAHAMTSDRAKCLEAGMDDYLAKPVRREHVDKVLERWRG
jgi:signal transduction histidine kinase